MPIGEVKYISKLPRTAACTVTTISTCSMKLTSLSDPKHASVVKIASMASVFCTVFLYILINIIKKKNKENILKFYIL